MRQLASVQKISELRNIENSDFLQVAMMAYYNYNPSINKFRRGLTIEITNNKIYWDKKGDGFAISFWIPETITYNALFN